MKSSIAYYILFLFLFALKIPVTAGTGTDKITLSGKVIAKTGETLPGATIYIPDLKTGAATEDMNRRLQNRKSSAGKSAVRRARYRL